MRNTNDQLAEILKRSDRLVEKKAAMHEAGAYGLSALACIALMIATVVHLPKALQGITEGGAENIRYGSLLLKTEYLGYVVIGLLAFLLGVFVTMITLRLREARKE
jgi:hypothetical protein